MAPGTNTKSNPNAMASCAKNAIFTNTALTDDGDVWWEGMTDTPPAHLIDWTGKDWTPGCGRPAAHPNARLRAGLAMPVHRPRLGESRRSADQRVGVRRADEQEHASGVPGVQLEPRRLSRGDDGVRGHCGGDRGDRDAARPDGDAALLRLQHGRLFQPLAERRPARRQPAAHLPRELVPPRRDNKFLWPGFGENIRVLWIVDRVHGRGYGVESPIGWMPRLEDIDWRGLDYDQRRSTS